MNRRTPLPNIFNLVALVVGLASAAGCPRPEAQVLCALSEADRCYDRSDCEGGEVCALCECVPDPAINPDSGGFSISDPGDDQVCTGGSDQNGPSPATDITSATVVSAGGIIEATITFAGDAEAFDNATDDKFPFSLQFNMTGGGPNPEAYFEEKLEMKMSNQGNIVGFLFFGDTLTIHIDGVSLPDVAGIRVSTFYSHYSSDVDGTTIYCDDEGTTPGY